MTDTGTLRARKGQNILTSTSKGYKSDTPAAVSPPSPARAAERHITVNGITIHMKSIFTGQTKVEDALQKIVVRRMTETKNNSLAPFK